MKPKFSALSTLALLLTAGCGSLADSQKQGEGGKDVDCDCTPQKRSDLTSEVKLVAETYSSCSALRKDLDIIRNRRKLLEESFRTSVQESTNSSSSSSSKSASSSGDVLTNIQESGVDESDLYKVSADHILALIDGDLHVASRHTFGVLGKLSLGAHHAVHMFVSGSTLVVVDLAPIPPQSLKKIEEPSLQLTSIASSSAPRYGGFTPDSQSNQSRVRTFALSKGALPVAKETKTLAGRVTHTRLVDDKLVLVLAGSLDVEPLSVATKNSVNDVACDKVHKPAIHNMDQTFTRVSTLDVNKLSLAGSDTGFLGAGHVVYMASNAIYVGAAQYAWDYRIPATGKPEPIPQNEERLVLHRIAFDPNKGLGQVSLGSVMGRVKDEWAFKQTGADGQYLNVATTTGQLWSEGADAASNHLTVLETSGASLRAVGHLSDFGRKEDIRSIRYVGNTAYVVTFKKTDPLFAIDISNPTNPKLLGELKIPGFSTYMHPVGENRLVGLGFEAEEMGDFAYYQGLQFSLFDVSDKKNPKRLDVKVHGERGSSSEATADHHAFHFDEESGIVAFPVVEVRNPDGRNGGWASGSEPPVFSGAVFYDVTGDSLKEVARLSHAEWIPEECKNIMGQGQWWEGQTASFDIARVFKVDGHTLTLSPFGFKSWTKSVTAPATKAAKWTRSGKQNCAAGH
ncbi:MAG: beta-propeller domain-containing protein [Silvanigrellales bacterium]|nr:beta-propeller domain-containing protein [Silvanigrellales bacterium]